jgi:hypothetical protein
MRTLIALAKSPSVLIPSAKIARLRGVADLSGLFAFLLVTALFFEFASTLVSPFVLVLFHSGIGAALPSRTWHAGLSRHGSPTTPTTPRAVNP